MVVDYDWNILKKKTIYQMLCVEKLMLPPDWNHLYHKEFEKTVRHVRVSSRFLTFLVYMAVLATVISTTFNQKLLFPCYFPFETRYAHSLQGYLFCYCRGL